ncbi:MAG: AAA family ATPase [Chloroflexi bacterium]|nr:AAA family ATPase [Chloroflexota bacterium]
MSTVAQRIVVVGTTGCGKTTLARRIATLLDLPCVELDALYWGPDWTPVPPDVFRDRVDRAIAHSAWVVDGNYSALRQNLWGTADTIVWLDYPLPLILLRLFRRTLRRTLGQEELWNGNRESVSRTLFSGDSIILWALRTYQRRRRTYEQLMQDPELAHLCFVRLRWPNDTETWMRSLEAAAPA